MWTVDPRCQENGGRYPLECRCPYRILIEIPSYEQVETTRQRNTTDTCVWEADWPETESLHCELKSPLLRFSIFTYAQQ